MAHGYMREFDEGRGDERDRWRNADPERTRPGNERDRSERNPNFMLGERDRGWERDRDRSGGFFGSMRNQARERGAFGGHGGWERSSPKFRSTQDDHYLSWRARQIEALDRDYADYCREREQQFHEDFDSWRRSHRQPENSKDELLLNTPRPTTSAATPSETAMETQATVEPESAAMLDSTGKKTGAR